LYSAGVTRNYGFPEFRVPEFAHNSGFPESPGTPGSPSLPEMRVPGVTRKSGFPVPNLTETLVSKSNPELQEPESSELWFPGVTRKSGFAEWPGETRFPGTLSPEFPSDSGNARTSGSRSHPEPGFQESCNFGFPGSPGTTGSRSHPEPLQHFSNLVIIRTYLPMKMEQSVPKRRHINFRLWGLTQKKAYSIQNTAKV
jgi:hypothetical protein